ncbi:hypothetical protein BU16DRAFT_129546 [Lophium mytilinum]|uniref:Uncharacterized protein n=1 Tax=Lophium mytilinum TaxID=390894 RepID=A0A6A6QIA7_9PEZI|nr:hypothetical protein BU16DRAFT_129546 [Lophium mytilinum]
MDITDRLQTGQAALDAAKKVSKHLLEPDDSSSSESTLLSTFQSTFCIPPSPIEEDTVLLSRTSSPTKLNVNVLVTLSPTTLSPVEPSYLPSPYRLGRWFGSFRRAPRRC